MVFYDILQHRSCDKIYQGLHPQLFVMKLLYLHPYHTPTTTPPPTHTSSHHPYHHTFTHTHHTPITQIHILTTPIHIPTIPTHTHSTTHPYRLCPYPTTHTHPTHILPTHAQVSTYTFSQILTRVVFSCAARSSSSNPPSSTSSLSSSSSLSSECFNLNRDSEITEGCYLHMYDIIMTS